ncbi:MAG TPA: ROK family protein, partial [Opitutus sp.]|nr:ROK family protein [Opitutus sp.]
MKTPPVWIGLDIGGTRLKGGAFDDHGRVIARDIEPTRPQQSHAALERQLNALVSRLLRTAKTNTPAGIGAAITGPVDPERGCVYLPGKIAGLDRHATVPFLSKRWRAPAIADNDGRLACYAEWRAGAGRGVDNLVVFTLGTGIGSGVVLDGRLLTDRRHMRGTQCGHLVIEVGGPRCLTGARGTGESLASVTALVNSVRDALARG